MWTKENRRVYERPGLRYPSDLTDDEWALVEPLIPPAKRGGRQRTVNIREVLNGIFYVLMTGCQWRALPKDLPPPRARFMNISGCGSGMAPWPASITPCSSKCGNFPARKPVQRPPSSTVRASKAPKKGGAD